MAERIPQSVAIRVPLQGFLAADHFSPATGLTIAITISKNGGAYGNPNAGATNATGIANGSYYVDLGTTDTNTVGPLFVRGTSATMDPITAIYNVVAYVDQTGDSYARIGAPAGASISADIAAVKVDTAAVKLQTDKLAFTVANQVDCNVLDWKSSAAPAMTGDAFARLGAPAGASVSADVAAVKVDTAAVKVKTDFLPSAVAGATGGVFIAGTNAATTITTGLTTTFTGNLTGSVASVTGAVGSVTGAVGSVTGAVGSVTGAVGSVTGSVGSVTGAVGSVTAVVSANITKVNGTTVNGSGTSGSPWGP